jgi:dTDP-4-dehydrorhamnose 3,5-epimerase-like enzyme
MSLRSKADDFWFLIEGTIECIARDMRSGSPTEGEEMQFKVVQPSRIMVPFGVAFSWRALERATLMLYLTTDFNHDPEDRLIPLSDGE